MGEGARATNRKDTTKKARKWQRFWKEEEREMLDKAERFAETRERCIENREYEDAIKATTQLIGNMFCAVQARHNAKLFGKAAVA